MDIRDGVLDDLEMLLDTFQEPLRPDIQGAEAPTTGMTKGDVTSEKTSAHRSVKDAGNHVWNDTTAKIKNDLLAQRVQRVLAIKIAELLGTIQCLGAFVYASQEIVSGLVGGDSPTSSTGGAAGSEPGQAQRGLSADGAVKDDSETAVAGTSARRQGLPHPCHAAIALSVDHDADESGRGSQQFDEMIARTHAARLATIEAALDNQISALQAAVRAGRATATFDTTATLADRKTATTNTSPLSPCRCKYNSVMALSDAFLIRALQVASLMARLRPCPRRARERIFECSTSDRSAPHCSSPRYSACIEPGTRL